MLSSLSSSMVFRVWASRLRCSRASCAAFRRSARAAARCCLGCLSNNRNWRGFGSNGAATGSGAFVEGWFGRIDGNFRTPTLRARHNLRRRNDCGSVALRLLRGNRRGRRHRLVLHSDSRRVLRFDRADHRSGQPVGRDHTHLALTRFTLCLALRGDIGPRLPLAVAGRIHFVRPEALPSQRLAAKKLPAKVPTSQTRRLLFRPVSQGMRRWLLPQHQSSAEPER